MVEYTEYAVNKRNNQVLKMAYKFEPSLGVLCFIDKDYRAVVLRQEEVVRIPKEFFAYVKEDSVCHGFKGLQTKLDFDEYQDGGLLWFKSQEKYIPIWDIDIDTIQPIAAKQDEDEFIIPPMPTLEELNKCTVVFNGRKTIITYRNFFVGEATCHKEDKFDVGVGIAIAYDRAKKAMDEHHKRQDIKAGDSVKVIHPGKAYSTSVEKVIDICKENKCLSLCTKYVYGELLWRSEDRFGVFSVLGVDGDYAYIQHKANGKCRLVDMNGIEKIEGGD